MIMIMMTLEYDENWEYDDIKIWRCDDELEGCLMATSPQKTGLRLHNTRFLYRELFVCLQRFTFAAFWVDGSIIKFVLSCLNECLPPQYVYVYRGALTIPSWSPGCLAGPGRPQLWNRALHLVPGITHSPAKKFPDSGAEGPGEPTAGNWPHIWPNFALLGRFWWCRCWCWHYCCFRLTQLRQKRSQFRS